MICSPEEFNKAKSRSNIKLKCDRCEKIFYRTKNLVQRSIKHNTPICCSRKCIKVNNKIRKKCGYCQKDIVVLFSENKIINFCSHFCSASFYNNLKYPKYNNICLFCQKQFKSKIAKEFCNSTCKKQFRLKQQTKSCIECGQSTTNRKFCGRICQNLNINKRQQGARSKGEIMLVEKLKNKFPSLEIIANDRQILNGLELDIYIPSIKLAIEWNGVFHFEPVRGYESLLKTINKDSRKKILCESLGIQLLIISDPKSSPKFYNKISDDAVAIVEKIYNETILK